MESIAIKQAITGSPYFEVNTRFGTMSNKSKDSLVAIMQWVFGDNVEIKTELAEITNRKPFPGE